MLKDELKIVLGSSFVFYVKSAGFHWNVEGANFPQYHEFLGNLYAEVYGSIDRMAEVIRQLDSYAPGSLTRFQELSVIQEQDQIPRAELMMSELLDDNNKLLDCLNRAFTAAEVENKQGIANFLAERIDAHSKHGWVLRSILKQARG